MVHDGKLVDLYGSDVLTICNLMGDKFTRSGSFIFSVVFFFQVSFQWRACRWIYLDCFPNLKSLSFNESAFEQKTPLCLITSRIGTGWRRGEDSPTLLGCCDVGRHESRHKFEVID